MKKFFLLAGICLALAGCARPRMDNSIAIVGAVEDPVGGAAAVNRKLNHVDTPYFQRHEYYLGMPQRSGTILPEFKTYQQTSDYSGAAACMVMTMEYYDEHGASEAELAKALDCRPLDNPREDGSVLVSTQMLVDYLTSQNFVVQSSLTTAGEDGKSFATLQEFIDYAHPEMTKGLPIWVLTDDWGGHWSILIGYDSMGTDDLRDDVFIFADPSDLYDHQQDGYTTINAVHFFDHWKAGENAPEGQRIQQYFSVRKWVAILDDPNYYSSSEAQS